MPSRRGAAPSALPAAGRHKSALHDHYAPGVGVLGTSSMPGSTGDQRVCYTDVHKQSDKVSMSSLRVGREGRVEASCLGGAIFPGGHLHLSMDMLDLD